MDADTLARAMRIPVEHAATWAEPLTKAMAEFAIEGLTRQSMFLAQLAHESNGLTRLVENLNYSAEQLARTWARFSTTGQRGGPPNELARQLARRPEAIANEVYANRMGNGSRESGDGWAYRGRSPIMLTGRNAYRRMGKRLGLELEHTPDLALVPAHGALIACAFWYDAGLNDVADRGDFDAVSDQINLGRNTEAFGDSIGFADRLAKYEHMVQVLA